VKKSFSLAVVATLLLAVSIFINSHLALAQTSTSFIRVQGNQLMLGSNVFKVKGYHINDNIGAYRPWETGKNFSYKGWNPQELEEELIYLSETMGSNVVRVNATFGTGIYSSTPVDGELYWTDNKGNILYDPYGKSHLYRLKTFLDLAQKHGIYVIVDLFQGVPGLVTYPWVSISSSVQLPAPGDATESYHKKHITNIVTPLKDHPAILAWQVKEELGGGAIYNDSTRWSRTLSWLKRMRDHIKSIDPNHLVAVEALNYIEPFVSASDLDKVNGGTSMTEAMLTDFITYSDYTTNQSFNLQYVLDRTTKPVVIGEFGSLVDPGSPYTACSPSVSESTQNSVLSTMINAVKAKGIAGALQWEAFSRAQDPECSLGTLYASGPHSIVWSTASTPNWFTLAGHPYIRMRQGGRTFRDSFQVPNGPLPKVKNAQFVSQSVPSSMTAGKQYTLSVTMKNTGAGTWHNLGGFVLTPTTSTYPSWLPNPIYLNPNELLGPGQTKTFSFNVTAPSTSGTYTVGWRMEQLGVEKFGDFTPSVTIVVGSSSTTYPTPTTTYATPTTSSSTSVVVQKFKIGDRVKTTSRLNVRATQGGKRLGAQVTSSSGTVVGGSEKTKNNIWWNVDYDIAPDGWSAENWLEKVLVTSVDSQTDTELVSDTEESPSVEATTSPTNQRNRLLALIISVWEQIKEFLR